MSWAGYRNNVCIQSGLLCRRFICTKGINHECSSSLKGTSLINTEIIPWKGCLYLMGTGELLTLSLQKSRFYCTAMLFLSIQELPPYLTNYRNPCWHEALPAEIYPRSSPYWYWYFKYQTIPAFHRMQSLFARRRSRGDRWRLRCLPLVYQIGVMKCGTSDLYYSLTRHPDVVRPMAKEPNYWSSLRFGKQLLAEHFWT